MVAKSEKVDLGVFRCLENPLSGEFLIPVAIFLVFSLLGGKELGDRGIIMDEKVCVRWPRRWSLER